MGHKPLFRAGTDLGRVGSQTPTVYDTDPRTKNSVINATKTEGAWDKMEKIKERFRTWVWEDDERRERLCREYNDEFNSVRLRVFNGAHLRQHARFEELGIDRLFVDEAHKFNNRFYVTKMTRVAGLPQTASERACDLLEGAACKGAKLGGGVVFATGTPISNTMAEMFTMQRYLHMGTLRRNGFQHFDS